MRDELKPLDLAQVEADRKKTTDSPPDYFGTLRGYRIWKLEDGHLTSIFQTCQWSSGVNEADCPSWRPELYKSIPDIPLSFGCSPEVRPRFGCSCGLYGMWTPHGAPYGIKGVIECWGPFVVCTKGFRARYACVTGLACCRPKQRKALRKNYPHAQLFWTTRGMYRKFPPMQGEVADVRLPKRRWGRGWAFLPFMANLMAIGVFQTVHTSLLFLPLALVGFAGVLSAYFID